MAIFDGFLKTPQCVRALVYRRQNFRSTVCTVGTKYIVCASCRKKGTFFVHCH